MVLNVLRRLETMVSTTKTSSLWYRVFGKPRSDISGDTWEESTLEKRRTLHLVEVDKLPIPGLMGIPSTYLYEKLPDGSLERINVIWEVRREEDLTGSDAYGNC